MLHFENKARQEGFRLILGIDEAGRGPLAGPVVASAILLKSRRFQNKITDSKKMSAQQRQKAYHEILEKAYVGVGIMSESVIDTVNILEATFLAMNNAVRELVTSLPHTFLKDGHPQEKTCLLVDGPHFKTDLPYSYRTIVKGDQLSLSIACASIVAKVMRDRILNIYDRVFPQYGFKRHKGYPTPQHKEAIQQFGPSFIHRKTFRY